MALPTELTPLTVDRNSPLPLYHQLREALLQWLKDGQYREGALIPTEHELGQIFQVSRITVSRAIDDLVREGYLVSKQGKGTFVARAKIQRHMPQMKSFSEEMAEQSRRPGSRLLFLGHVRAQESVAEALHLPPDGWVWAIERLRTADDEPVCLSMIYLNLPPHIFLTPLELEQEVSLWKLLQAKRIEVDYREEHIQSIAAGAREAELLEIEPGAPLLFVVGTVYSSQGEPIEYHEIYNRGDRYTYTVQTGRKTS